MSLISIGKRIGDLDIRLGIPPSKPQFSTREANRRQETRIQEKPREDMRR